MASEGPKTVSEGAVTIAPLASSGKKNEREEVFYNPSQVFNRDISSLVIRAFHAMRCDEKKVDLSTSKLSILELLGASGIRSCRYAKEMDDIIERIVCNDLDSTATSHIVQNAKANGVEDKVYATCGDATALCNGGNSYLFSTIERQKDPKVIQALKTWSSERMKHLEKTDNFTEKKFTKTLMDEPFEVIDIDPYGSASPFLDSAIRRVANGGLLCVTCTDMQVLTSGSYPETIWSKYGGMQLTKPNASWIHEMSLRILMNTINNVANKYGVIAEPLFCLSVDFYVRCFIQIRKSPMSAKFTGQQTSVGLMCPTCENTNFLPFGKSLPGIRGDQGESFVTKDPLDHQGYPTLISNAVQAEFGNKLKFKTPTVENLTLGQHECLVCGETERKPYLFGPFYSGSLFHPAFVRRVQILAEDEEKRPPHITMGSRIAGMLYAMQEELRDVPLYYTHTRICAHFKIHAIPSSMMRTALTNLGYRSSQHHRDPEALKTNAPIEVVHDIIRKWAKKDHEKRSSSGEDVKPLHPFLLRDYTTSAEKMDGCFQTKVSVGGPAETDKEATGERKRKVAKWMNNPLPNWGPQQRAKKAKTDE